MVIKKIIKKIIKIFFIGNRNMFICEVADFYTEYFEN